MWQVQVNASSTYRSNRTRPECLFNKAASSLSLSSQSILPLLWEVLASFYNGEQASFWFSSIRYSSVQYSYAAPLNRLKSCMESAQMELSV